MTENEIIIYRLCNANNWFTGGDIKAYRKLMELAGDCMPYNIIANCIWMVSDDSYTHIFDTVAESGYTQK